MWRRKESPKCKTKCLSLLSLVQNLNPTLAQEVAESPERTKEGEKVARIVERDRRRVGFPGGPDSGLSRTFFRALDGSATATTGARFTSAAVLLLCRLDVLICLRADMGELSGGIGAKI